MTMWTRYDYLCTNCDALIEVTARAKHKLDPDCICGNGNVINIGTSPAYKPVVTDVTNITPTRVVKIDSNPYN
jgi:hypothetical protein